MKKESNMPQTLVAQALPGGGQLLNSNDKAFYRSLNLKNIFNFKKPEKNFIINENNYFPLLDEERVEFLDERSEFRNSGEVEKQLPYPVTLSPKGEENNAVTSPPTPTDKSVSSSVEFGLWPHQRLVYLLKRRGECKAAFTLAETMIVIVVLGIIATLTIPALVNKNKESVAKTKVRKAMAAYESALNKMIIENDLRSDETLTDWAGNANNNCANSTQYFKKSKDINGCIFKTSDGVWWDISNIERPVISFREITNSNKDTITANANNADDKTAFVLVGRFGTDGSLRVDDLAYETANSIADANGNQSKAQVEKLYGLLGLEAAGNTLQCDDSNTICRKLRGDYDDYSECSGTHKACYTHDQYCDYHGESGLGSYYNRCITRYFYYDENGTYMGEYNIDNTYGSKGFWQFRLKDGATGTVSKYRDDSVANREIVTTSGRIRVGYYEVGGQIGHIEIYDHNIIGESIDVYYSQDGTCAYSDQAKCARIMELTNSVLQDYGIIDLK